MAYFQEKKAWKCLESLESQLNRQQIQLEMMRATKKKKKRKIKSKITLSKNRYSSNETFLIKSS